MGLLIDSGTGNAKTAGVSDDNRLLTESLSRPQLEQSTTDGDVYWFATNFISLTTTASFTGLWYVKNTSASETLYIDFLRTCGSKGQEWRLIKNPTTGTLITAGTAGTPVNSRFDSGNTFTGSFIVGADAQTITDGTVMGSWINQTGHSINRFEGAIQLTPNTSLALTVKPSVAGDFCVTCMAWQK